jgi:hypothetical protein
VADALASFEGGRAPRGRTGDAGESDCRRAAGTACASRAGSPPSLDEDSFVCHKPIPFGARRAHPVRCHAAGRSSEVAAVSTGLIRWQGPAVQILGVAGRRDAHRRVGQVDDKKRSHVVRQDPRLVVGDGVFFDADWRVDIGVDAFHCERDMLQYLARCNDEPIAVRDARPAELRGWNLIPALARYLRSQRGQLVSRCVPVATPTVSSAAAPGRCPAAGRAVSGHLAAVDPPVAERGQ